MRSEEDWRAIDDARILSESEMIKTDKKRLTKAKKQARRMAQEKTKEAKALKKIATKKVRKKKVRKKNGKK